jgi:hypothetical protein
MHARHSKSPSFLGAALLLAAGAGLGGCDAGGGGFPDLPEDTDGQCQAVAGNGWVGASTANLQFQLLLINGTVQVTDVNNITGCVREDGTGGAWLVDDTFGNPFMAIINGTTATGAQQVTTGTFLVDVYGYQPGISFGASDFFAQQWQVNTLSPFQASFQGSATNSGNHQLEIQYFGTVTP